MTVSVVAPRGRRYPLFRHRDTGEIVGDYINLSTFPGLDTSAADPGSTVRAANAVIIKQAVDTAIADGVTLLWDVDTVWHSAIWADSNPSTNPDPIAADGLKVVGDTPYLRVTRTSPTLPRIIGSDGTTTPNVAWKVTGAFGVHALRLERPGATARGVSSMEASIWIQNSAAGILQDTEHYRSASATIHEMATMYPDPTDKAVSLGTLMKNVLSCESMADGFYSYCGTVGQRRDNCVVVNPGDDYFPCVNVNGFKDIADCVTSNCFGRRQVSAGRGIGIVSGTRNIWDHVNIHGSFGIGVYVGENTGSRYATDCTVQYCNMDHPGAIAVDMFSNSASIPNRNFNLLNTVITGATGLGFLHGNNRNAIWDHVTWNNPGATNAGLLITRSNDLTINNSLCVSPTQNFYIFGGNSGDESLAGDFYSFSGNTITGMLATFRPWQLTSRNVLATFAIGAGNNVTGSPAEFLRANYGSQAASTLAASACLLNGAAVTGANYTVQTGWTIT